MLIRIVLKGAGNACVTAIQVMEIRPYGVHKSLLEYLGYRIKISNEIYVKK